MEKTFAISLIFLLTLLIVPLAKADLITPGMKSIGINNIITNVDDFSDYYLISTCHIMGEPQIIPESGLIPPYYKLCSIEIYAVEKDKFNLIITQTEDSNKEVIDLTLNNLSQKSFNNYLLSIGAIKLAENIRTYSETLITSPTNEITNYYTLILDKVKSSPDEKVKSRSDLIYIYIIIPIIALVTILIIFLNRKK